MSITVKPFGTTKNGFEAKLYTLKSPDGASVSLTDYGAHLVSVLVPDKNGTLGEVCLGYDDVRGYEENGGFLGATVGRFANRIGGGSFPLNGKTYPIFKNDGENTLHGGEKGFDTKPFTASAVEGAKEDTVIFQYLSPDMEEGFPGNLQLQVAFTWDESHTLSIRYMATSDQDTVVNFTNHAYWNLSGEADILQEKLTINSFMMTEVDSGLIPTGNLTNLEGGILDLRRGRTVADLLAKASESAPIAAVNGLDFNFILPGDGLKEAATLKDASTGRRMRVLTTEPAIQAYSGQGLDQVGHGGKHYGPFGGVALETQHFPDSPHHMAFPSTILRAGDTFESQTMYVFSADAV
ncbi:MAG: galactose mutarotase [Clostridia bacterium]|nr:galactose mutarotase [Clostridia bacterium]